ncbi:MAG: protein translocase subunit SecD [Alphaproteobacteria bacterium]
MLQIERWKIILIVVLSVLGIAYAVPNVLSAEHQTWLTEHVPGWMPNKTINLGLDLRGGSHLLLEADTKKVLTKRIATMRKDTVSKLRGAGILYFAESIGVKNNSVTIKLQNPAKDATEAKRVLRDIDKLAAVEITEDGVITVMLDERAVDTINAQVIDQSIEIVRKRVDETGTKEPVIQRQGSNRIVVQLPGVGDPAHIKHLLGTTAEMTFHLMDEDAMTSGQLNLNSLKVTVHGMPGRTIVVKREAVLDGERLTDAQPAFDQNGNPVVSFRFDNTGAKIFCDITRENVGKPFAILMDDEQGKPEAITFPTINEPICGGAGQISGRFETKEVNDIALLLRAGALPAPLNVVEERTVGPTLGSDSVSAGKIAALYAFVAVFLLMALSYGLFGLFAGFALILNIAFIFAVLSMLQATLTLPGIAGIILTIGIAVDANVLVYERIREELRNGRSVISAIDKGYLHARGTIIDANLTTLIVALILFSFGSGPVKGFAVAMTIGIVTSIFCALMLTRLMVLIWLRQTKPSTLDL